MYRKYFGLKEKPFELSPDPKFLYLSEAHKEAFAHLKYGVKEKKGFVVITGEVGTGKTTLLNALIEQLNTSIKRIYMTDPGLTSEDLFYMIGRALELSDFDGNKGKFLWSLNEYFREKLPKEEHVLLIIDESQNLSPEMLEEVRLLSNLETPERRLFQIFLIGQQELNLKLQSPRLRQLRQRIALKYNLTPLDYNDTLRYIKHRLYVAGYRGKKDIFHKSALKLIFKYTKGYPRLINIICDQALLTAYSKSELVIKKSIIKEVIKDVEISYEGPKHNKMKGIYRLFRRFTFIVLFCFAITGLAATGYYFYEKFPIALKDIQIAKNTSLYNSTPISHENKPKKNAYRTEGEKKQSQLPLDSAATQYTHKNNLLPAKKEIDTPTTKTQKPIDIRNKTKSQEKKIIKKTIYFRYNNWRVKNDAISILKQVTRQISSIGKPYSILVEGFSDPSGSMVTNLKVSEARANAVANWLIQKGGIKPKDITIKAWGASKAMETNVSPQNMWKNRRAEITVTIHD